MTKVNKIKHVTYTYEVEDNFGWVQSFNTEGEAQTFAHHVEEEKKVLNYLRPKGVTLVVSKDKNVFCKCIPAFIGFNGAVFCEAPKDKDRDFYHNLNNSVQRTSDIYGNMVTVMKKVFTLLYGLGKFDTYNGAYHYYWDPAIGNRTCQHICHPDHWMKGAYWYNWDGNTFTTNDPNCKITDMNF